MNDKPASTELATLESLSPFGIDLDIAAQLGAKAEGIEIVMIDKPVGMMGVPDKIPVALRRGSQPGVLAVAEHFESYRDRPQRKAGQAIAQTFESLVKLTNRHKTEHSAIFANMDWRKPSLTTVIDYHENAQAGRADRGKHRIHYAYPLSEEWQAWVKLNGEVMKQTDFAWFLEDRIPELSSPTEEEKIRYEKDFACTIATPAQVVELSRGLQVFVDTKVKNTTTLQSGEGQIAFEETHNGADGKPIKVPGLFMLAIAPFFMGDKIRIPVRLRYRTLGGNITWFYQIYRPDQFITEHVRNTLADVRAQTDLPTYEGTPEMAA